MIERGTSFEEYIRKLEARSAELEAEIARLTAINADLRKANLSHAEGFARIAELEAEVAEYKARGGSDKGLSRRLQVIAENGVSLESDRRDVRKAAARIAETEAERDRLKAALEPFVEFMERQGYHDSYWSDDDMAGSGIRVGDLRRALAAISGEGVKT